MGKMDNNNMDDESWTQWNLKEKQFGMKEIWPRAKEY